VTVGFEALLKSLESKSLVSGDKCTRVVLEFDSSDALQLLNDLNALHSAEKLVAVAISDGTANNKKAQRPGVGVTRKGKANGIQEG
jgi:hypothetical protein